MHEGHNVAIASEAEIRCADLTFSLPVGHRLPVCGLSLGSLCGRGARRYYCGRLTCMSGYISPIWAQVLSAPGEKHSCRSRSKHEDTSQTCGLFCLEEQGGDRRAGIDCFGLSSHLCSGHSSWPASGTRSSAEAAHGSALPPCACAGLPHTGLHRV